MPLRHVSLLTAALVIVAAFGAFRLLAMDIIYKGDGFSSNLPADKSQPAITASHDCMVVKEYPHDPEAFTQGLIHVDGFLYESTGLHGKSSLRQVDLETGKVLRKYSLPQQLFGEGLTAWKDKLIQLTWETRVGLVYQMADFRIERRFHYSTEGWGLTHDGESLIMSDGTAVLYFLDPDQFTEVRRISVKDHGAPVRYLNELEYINGEIYANIWQSDYVARISPATGDVLGWIDLGRLKSMLGPVRNVDVLNGIAYDATQDRLFVTGKLWPKLFEIKIIPISR